MKLTAAFLWDSSTKTISYMIIDESYNKRLRPRNKKINSNDFENEVEREISSFFKAIKELDQNSNKVKIEHKILGHGSPAYLIGKKLKKASEHSEYVKAKFLEMCDELKKENNSIKLIKQCRSKLTKNTLKNFNKDIDDLTLVKKERGYAYQYHLWALALHATKSNYPEKIRKLKKALMKSETKEKQRPQATKKKLSLN